MSGCLMSTLACKPHLLTKGMLFKKIVVIKEGNLELKLIYILQL